MKAIQRARQEPLDFQPVELDALELTAHYVFYYLEKRESPAFGRMSKREYSTKIRQLAKSGQTLRIGKLRLSVHVRKAELFVGKAELAKLVEKLEALDEF